MNDSGGTTDRITAESVRFEAGSMYVYLSDKRYISVPLNVVPTLDQATPEQLNRCELIARGTGIHWEELDEDLSVVGLARNFSICPAEPGR